MFPSVRPSITYHWNPSPCNLEKSRKRRAHSVVLRLALQSNVCFTFAIAFFPDSPLWLFDVADVHPSLFLVLGNARFDFLPSVRLFVHPFAAVHFCLLALYNCWASNCCFSTPWKTTVCCVYSSSSSSSTDLLNKFTGTTIKRLRYKCLHMGWSIHCMWLITTPPFVSPP